MKWVDKVDSVQGITALVVVCCVMLAGIMIFNGHMFLAMCFLIWSIVGCGAICWEDIVLARRDDEVAAKKELE